MEFGIFTGMYVPQTMVDEHGDAAEMVRLQQELDWVRTADRAGFKYLWATEHHFLEEYSHLSANEAFLGWCAAATERIHIGSGIFNITPPVNHPFRTAEKVAMLDHLSGGRFELGMGRGSSTLEQSGFGIQDPDLTRDMFDEVVPQLKHMWREEAYSFEGEFFSMPEPMWMRSVAAAHQPRKASLADMCEYSSRKWCSVAHRYLNPERSAALTHSSSFCSWMCSAASPCSATIEAGVYIPLKIPNSMGRTVTRSSSVPGDEA